MAFVVSLAGCATTSDRADAAFARRDWDDAAKRYQAALGSGDSPDAEARIVARLAESRQRAGQAHREQSLRCEAAGDLDRALSEAEAALASGQDGESAKRVGEVRGRAAAQYLDSGRGALDARRWNEAVRLLGRAQSLAPGAATQELLGRAQAGAEEARKAAGAEALAAGDAAMQCEDWASAATLYTQASTQVPSPRTSSLASHCSEMGQAEAAARAGNPTKARAHYERAAATGVDPDRVRARMRATVPARYRITVHGASILPFKPGSELAWDGPNVQVEGAGTMLAELAGVTGPAALLAGPAFAATMKQIEPPDCFIVVRTASGAVGSGVVENTLLPSWSYPFDIVGTSTDPTVVQFRVTDSDALDHDPVGTWQTTIGALVMHEAPWQERFINEKRELRAGGILTLDLSVDPRSAQVSAAEAVGPRVPVDPSRPALPAGPRTPSMKGKK